MEGFYRDALIRGEEVDSKVSVRMYMVSQRVSQDLGIPHSYLGDPYMVAEHRKALRRMKVDWAGLGSLDGRATAAELTHTDERFDLERSARWGDKLLAMYDKSGLGGDFDDALAGSLRIGMPASLSSARQTGPHAEPEQSMSTAFEDGMRCYNLKEVTRATARYAKSQAPELADIGISYSLQAERRKAVLEEGPASRVNEDGMPTLEELEIEKLQVPMSKQEEDMDRHFAACEDEGRVFPPRLLRANETVGESDLDLRSRNTLEAVRSKYDSVPLGVRMTGAYPLYKIAQEVIKKDQSGERDQAELDSKSKRELLMQTGIAGCVDAKTSLLDVLRRVAHCAAYARGAKAPSEETLRKLVRDLLKIS